MVISTIVEKHKYKEVIIFLSMTRDSRMSDGRSNYLSHRFYRMMMTEIEKLEILMDIFHFHNLLKNCFS